MSITATSVSKRAWINSQLNKFSLQRERRSRKTEIAFFVSRLPGSRPEVVSGCACEARRGDLRLGHFFGLWAFRALRHFKFDFLTLFESLEAVPLNGAIVNEDVRGTWLLNEAIALRVVKPLDLTGYSRHTNESS